MGWRKFFAAGVVLAAAGFAAGPATAQSYRVAPYPYHGTPAPDVYDVYDDELLDRPSRGYEPRAAYRGQGDWRMPDDARAPRPPGAIPGPARYPHAGQHRDDYTGSVQSSPLPPPGGVSGAPAVRSVPAMPDIGGRPPLSIEPQRRTSIAALPADDQPEHGTRELPSQFRRQLVTYSSKEPAGTIVIDTTNTYLYLVLGGGQAIRYGIGVGREGFTWSGVERVSRMAEWPDWHPPAEMIERQPYLPRFMAGGPGNPLGARALYLGKTLYRIHGTNQPSTIGQFVSSGCIRLLNEDIEDLYSRVTVGTRVVVLPGRPAPATAAVR